MRRPHLVLAMAQDLPDRLFTAQQRRRLVELCSVDQRLVVTDFHAGRARAALAEAEVLLTGWGCPVIDDDVLDVAPKLQAIVHAAGSVKAHVRAGAWRRGIAVSTAAQANACPVAEYTVAMILLAGKSALRTAATYRSRRGFVDVLREFPEVGNYRRRVGVVGASRTGRLVIESLRPFDTEVVVYDPYLDDADALRLGARRETLEGLLAGSDIITLHAPAIAATRHMINRRNLALIRDGATLINTARGWLIDQDALVDELLTGRFDAVLDVTEPDVLPEDSPLYTLDNVVLTPHIAGALGNELHRLADSALAELARYAAGAPFEHPVTAEHLERIA